jgi:hypothetical protein
MQFFVAAYARESAAFGLQAAAYTPLRLESAESGLDCDEDWARFINL